MNIIAALVLATCFLLSACVTVQKSVPPHSIRSVAIFSTLPDTLVLGYTGLTVFNNQRTVVDANFGLNELVVDDLKKALSPQYQIVPMTADKPVPDLAPDKSEEIAQISARLRETLTPGMVDAVLIVTGVPGPRVLNGVSSGSNIRVEGAVWSTSFERGGNAGVISVLEVFDGTTFELIGRSQASLIPHVEARWTGEPYTEVSDAAKSEVRTAVRKSIEETMPKKLKETGLVP